MSSSNARSPVRPSGAKVGSRPGAVVPGSALRGALGEGAAMTIVAVGAGAVVGEPAAGAVGDEDPATMMVTRLASATAAARATFSAVRDASRVTPVHANFPPT